MAATLSATLGIHNPEIMVYLWSSAEKFLDSPLIHPYIRTQ